MQLPIVSGVCAPLFSTSFIGDLMPGVSYGFTHWRQRCERDR